MGRAPATNPGRDLDRAILDATLAAHENAGQPIPCRTRALAQSSWWIEEDNPRAQTLAALACAPCPALTDCRDYGRAHQDEIGVYGGQTHQQRRPTRGRPPQHDRAAA